MTYALAYVLTLATVLLLSFICGYGVAKGWFDLDDKPTRGRL